MQNTSAKTKIIRSVVAAAIGCCTIAAGSRYCPAYGFSLTKKKTPQISDGKHVTLTDVAKTGASENKPENTTDSKESTPEAADAKTESETISPEDRALKTRIDNTPGVLIRMQGDKRIQSFCENYKKQRTVHVYLVLSELPTPYAISLGWLTPVNTAQGELSQDEFGEHVPVGQVSKKKFDKGDLAAIQGFDLISNGKLKEAGDQFRAAEKETPDSPRVHNNMGVFYAVTGDNKKAEEELTSALQLKPDYGVAQINAAWYEFAAGKTQSSYDIAHGAMKTIQNFPDGTLVAAQAANALTYHNEAVELAKPYSKDLLLGARFMQLLADANLALGDKDVAKSLYEKSALANPDSVETLLKLAKTQQESGDLDEAIKNAKRATEAAPSDPRAHLYLGLYLESNRDYRAAQLQFEQVLDLKPTDTVRQAAYGPFLRALLAQDNTEDADKLTKKWVKEYSNDPICHYNRAWFIGRIKSDEARAEAISEYKKALEGNPNLAQARYNLALLLINSGQHKPALLELKAFLKQSPEDSDAAKAKELVKRLEN
jgi:Flp pilus assembly protein TadD